MFKAAKWITNAKWGKSGITLKHNGSIILRRTFILEKDVRKATMYVCGLGYGEYTINGLAVTDEVLSTPFTTFDKRVLYQTYDVTSLLDAGENTIGVFLGNGFYNDVAETWFFDTATWRHCPKVILRLHVLFCDGTETEVISDENWMSCEGPVTYNRVRECEIYDARLFQEGWNQNGFNAENWDAAIICQGPGGVLEPADLPPIRVVKILKGQYLGDGIYDFGENISGWVKIKGKGKCGDAVTIHYAERYDGKDIDNTHIKIYMQGELQCCDRYIFKGSGIEEWSPRFVYHGFRYIKVENMPEDFSAEACEVHTDLSRIGSFQCADAMLEQIHDAAVRSILCNYHSIPTDCPHREQLGWTGDALNSAEPALYNFDMVRAYKSWMKDFKHAQRADGQLSCIIPTPGGWGYNWGNGPSFDSALIGIPWRVYVYTGDKSLIEMLWENMKRYMQFLSCMHEDYILDFGLPDWYPPENANKCLRSLTSTAFYFENAVTMQNCAQIMGENADIWSDLAMKIRRSFRKHFIQNRTVAKECQTAVACALYYGLLEEEEIPAAVQRLVQLIEEKDFHIDGGTLGVRYIFEVLSDYGYGSVAYKMITNPTKPSYASWILNGMTTLCETWEMNQSLNHHMFSPVETWFYKCLAGIRHTAAGLEIKPCIIPEISWIKASHGDVHVEWNEKELRIQTPVECKVIFAGREQTLKPGKHRLQRI